MGEGAQSQVKDRLWLTASINETVGSLMLVVVSQTGRPETLPQIQEVDGDTVKAPHLKSRIPPQEVATLYFL